MTEQPEDTGIVIPAAEWNRIAEDFDLWYAFHTVRIGSIDELKQFLKRLGIAFVDSSSSSAAPA